jgi:hypothetical protein
VRPWARPAAFVLEALGSALALSRIGSRPGAAVLALVLAAAVVGLLLSPSAARALTRRA